MLCVDADFLHLLRVSMQQVIDVDAGLLQNVITFPPSGAFIVDSSIAVEGPQRVSFKFSAAKLKTVGRDFAVPPFGQGWWVQLLTCASPCLSLPQLFSGISHYNPQPLIAQCSRAACSSCTTIPASCGCMPGYISCNHCCNRIMHHRLLGGVGGNVHHTIMLIAS
jgi:hypothetical protein